MRKLIAVCILMAAIFGTATAAMPNALATSTHSVALYGPVTCPAPYYTASRVRIQAVNGEARDAALSLGGRWYSVTFTQVPAGGENAYVYVSCGVSINGNPVGGVHGLSGPIHLNGSSGSEYVYLGAR